MLKMLGEKKKKYTHMDIKIENLLLHGYPPEKIIEFANNVKVDLIAIGNISLCGFLKLRHWVVSQEVYLR
jgi:nucleotide-binding universal stress UspA family protein